MHSYKDYSISGNYLSTDGVAGSPIQVVSIPFSSNATSTGNPYAANYYWSATYRKPKYPRNTYQVEIYNPTTNAIDCNVFAEVIGLSTGSTQDYCYITSFSIPGSTQSGLGRVVSQPIEGLFNGVNAQFRFTNPTTYATAETSTNYKTYMALKEYL